MKVVALVIALAAGFELLWASSSVLRPHRRHFRAMVGLFWGLTALIWAGNAWGLLPSSLYFNGVPRFASDAVTYQGQATQVADGLRSGSFVSFLDLQIFNYSRLLGVLFYVFDDSRLAASLFNVTFYMASVLAAFVLCQRLFDERSGIWAAWLAACWPVFLLYETQTLRWVTTTAGLHLVILGTVLAMGRGRWLLSMLCTFSGFAVLLMDMPQFARLSYVVAAAQALVLLVADLRARVLPSRAIRVAALVVGMAIAYDIVWVLLPRDTSSFAPSSLSRAVTGGDDPPLVAERPPRFDELPFIEAPSQVTFLDRLIAPILETRIGYIRQNLELQEDGIGVGTSLTAEPLRNSREFITNVPAALAAALLTPTPASLLRASGGASRLGPYSAIEVVVYYMLLGLMFVGLAQSLLRGGEAALATVYILLFTGAAYVIIGTVTMNGGTLHRFRLPYVVLHMVYAAPVLAAWVPALLRRVTGARQ